MHDFMECAYAIKSDWLQKLWSIGNLKENSQLLMIIDIPAVERHLLIWEVCVMALGEDRKNSKSRQIPTGPIMDAQIFCRTIGSDRYDLRQNNAYDIWRMYW